MSDYRQPPFVEKPFNQLTTEELRSMIRCKLPFYKIEPNEIADYYKVTASEYCDRIQELGIGLSKYDREFRWKSGVAEEEKRLEAEKQREEAKEEKLLETKVKQSEEDKAYRKNGSNQYNIPEYVICALFNVKSETIDGKRYYDREELNRANEELDRIVSAYMLGNQPRDQYQANFRTSSVKPIELIAMRIYRGMNRKTFSEHSGLSMTKIIEFETHQKSVSERIATIYVKTLQIKEKHLKLLRAVIHGEVGYIEENRIIPPIIKLQVWKRDKGKCTVCGIAKRLHYHHIKHFADGGLHTKDNLKLLCVACHAEEHKEDPSYYMLKSQAEQE